MRSVEEMQAGLRSAMNEIQSIKDDLEQFKNAKVSGELTADFKQISANAKRYPVSPHPLSKYDEHTKKLYLKLLLSITEFEPERLSESLYLAHRIAWGCKFLKDGDLNELFVSAQMLTFEQLDEATALFHENELRLMLVEEMLLTSGAFDKGRGAAFEYISNLCRLLNISKDETAFLSNMAAAVLTKDASKYRCKIDNKYDIFNVYLSEIEFPFSIYSVEIAEIVSTGYKRFRFDEVTFTLNENTLLSELHYRESFLTHSYANHTKKTRINTNERLILMKNHFSLEEIRDALIEQRTTVYSNSGSFIVPIGVLISPSPLLPENYPPVLDYYNMNKKIQYLDNPKNPICQ